MSEFLTDKHLLLPDEELPTLDADMESLDRIAEQYKDDPEGMDEALAEWARMYRQKAADRLNYAMLELGQ